MENNNWVLVGDTNSIDMEDIIQLAIYAWMFPQSNKDFKLLNVYSKELIEV